MRPLEIASLLALTVALVAQARRHSARRALFAVALAVMAAQAVVEGPRWQLVVAYLVAALGLLLALRRPGEPSVLSAFQAARRLALAALALLVAAALPVLLPVMGRFEG